MNDDSVIYKNGRVTGRIAPGTVGEVMIPIRGGVEAFLAQAADPGETIERGAPICVVEYYEPRTVLVTRLPQRT